MGSKGPPRADRSRFVRGSSPAKIRAWVVLALVILATAAVRLRLLRLPLERDEGEYAFGGQLLLDGVPPYVLLYNMKFPGIYAAYAAIMALFGQNAAGIHLGLTLVNAAAILLVFLLARRLFDALAGVAAAAVYAVLSTSPTVLGLMAHASHFVVLAALGGLLLTFRGLENKRRAELFLGGISLGLAILMKQPGALFCLLAAAMIWWDRRPPYRTRRRRLADVGLLAAGVVVPLVATALALAAAGVFGRFWHWTFTYASEYGTTLPLREGIASFCGRLPDIMGPGTWLWLIAGAGLIEVAWDPAARRASVFHVGLAVYLFLAAAAWLSWRQAQDLSTGLDPSRAAGELGRYRALLEATWGVLAAAGVAGLIAAARRGSSTSRAARPGGGKATMPGRVKAVVPRGHDAAMTGGGLHAPGPFCIGLVACSLVATSAGLYWREHYFIQMLPAVAILAAALVSLARRRLATAGAPAAVRLVPLGILVAALAFAGFGQRRFLLELSPIDACRSVYGTSPFPEAPDIARYLREHTSPGDRIAVLGSEPEIYFYAHRRPATGYIYAYPLMEPNSHALEMQNEMIGEIRAARPKYVVLVSPTFKAPYAFRTSWLWFPHSEKTVFRWINEWVRANYHVVGLITPGGIVPSLWGSEAAAKAADAQEASIAGRPSGTSQSQSVWSLLQDPVIAVLEANPAVP